jgi:hypothetical protein
MPSPCRLVGGLTGRSHVLVDSFRLCHEREKGLEAKQADSSIRRGELFTTSRQYSFIILYIEK